VGRRCVDEKTPIALASVRVCWPLHARTHACARMLTVVQCQNAWDAIVEAVRADADMLSHQLIGVCPCALSIIAQRLCWLNDG